MRRIIGATPGAGLAKKANKTDIKYTVDEVSVPADYTKTVSTNEAKTEYVITNTHVTETTEAMVKKVWNDSNDQDGKTPGRTDREPDERKHGGTDGYPECWK
ncbi:MAG: Cna B-type domain-containing protein [Blautia faecis]